MTIPFERTRSVLATKKFLEDLLDVQKTPRVPKLVRERAKTLLRHYPDSYDIEKVNRVWNNSENSFGLECPFASPDEDFFGNKTNK